VASPDIHFQYARSEHLPGVFDLLDQANMRDHRRDTTELVTQALDRREDAVIVGVTDDQEVIVSAYVGDILPIISGVVVREDFRSRGLGTSIMKIAIGVAKNMGHEYSEIIVDEKLISFYQRLGYYVTDTCTLMERPMEVSDAGSVEKLTGHRHAKFDYSRLYRSDVYQAAFSNLVTIGGSEQSLNFRQLHPGLNYTALRNSSGTFLVDRPDQGDEWLPPYLNGKMRQVSDPGLRDHGIFGWGVFRDEEREIEIVKVLGKEANKEPQIWSPMMSRLHEGVYYVRHLHDDRSPIVPAKLSFRTPDKGTCLDDIPSNLNPLIAIAQSVERSKMVA
jgi:GNAT superfamily N-acetyltransferase